MQRVSGGSAGGQVEIRWSESPHQPAEGSSMTVERLLNSSDLAGTVQVGVKVWTP